MKMDREFSKKKIDKELINEIVRKSTSNKRLGKRMIVKDNEHTIFVNAVRSIVHTFTTIEQL